MAKLTNENKKGEKVSKVTTSSNVKSKSKDLQTVSPKKVVTNKSASVSNSKKSSLSKKSINSKEKSVKSSNMNNKSNSRKKVVKKNAVKSKNELTSQNKSISFLEYYDLPYRYNETIVKILFQTPKTLFVYWDISDIDKEKYIKTFGDNFFENTKPVLIIHNKTKNYTFEIDINDFANSWYFNIEDSRCEYLVELGRRQVNNYTTIPNNYLYIASSNTIETPNNHILFEKEYNMLFFKNTKTDEIYSKNIVNLSLLKSVGKIYNKYDLYSLYTKLYKGEDIIDLKNPSSGNPTSTFN